MNVMATAKEKMILDKLKIISNGKKHRTPCQVIWDKSTNGWLKLNIDGLCRGNLRYNGVGGIIWDLNGIMKAAFFEKYDWYTTLQRLGLS